MFFALSVIYYINSQMHLLKYVNVSSPMFLTPYSIAFHIPTLEDFALDYIYDVFSDIWTRGLFFHMMLYSASCFYNSENTENWKILSMAAWEKVIKSSFLLKLQ